MEGEEKAVKESKKTDIITKAHIRELTGMFCERLRTDPLLGPLTGETIRGRWKEHREKTCRLWQSLLFDNTVPYSSFTAHGRLPVDRLLVDRWLELFRQSVDERFEGIRAEEAKWRAEKVAELFLYRVAFLREDPFQAPDRLSA